MFKLHNILSAQFGVIFSRGISPVRCISTTTVAVVAKRCLMRILVTSQITNDNANTAKGQCTITTQGPGMSGTGIPQLCKLPYIYVISLSFRYLTTGLLMIEGWTDGTTLVFHAESTWHYRSLVFQFYVILLSITFSCHESFRFLRTRTIIIVSKRHRQWAAL
jgi:hypothetical protein